MHRLRFTSRCSCMSVRWIILDDGLATFNEKFLNMFICVAEIEFT